MSGPSPEDLANEDIAEAKVVLLGSVSVGKSALALKYVRGEFSETLESTVGACFFAKRLSINGTDIRLQIWDTAGQERFHALTPLYYRGSVGAILVFDLSDQSSFKGVQTWMDELQKEMNGDMVLIVVGSKKDIFYSLPEDQRLVHVPQAAKEYAQSKGALYFETSAKTGEGIPELFETLAEEILKRGLATMPDEAAGGGGGGGDGGSGEGDKQGAVFRLGAADNKENDKKQKKPCACDLL